MQQFGIWLFLGIFFLGALLLIAFIIYSYIEKEKKAIERGTVALILFALVFLAISFIPENYYLWLNIIPLTLLLVIVAKFGNSKIEFKLPDNRFDERDVMFSRNTLKPGTDKFEDYYKRRSENKPLDDAFRKEPGLMAPGAVFYDEILFKAAHSTFTTVDLLQPLVEQPSAETKTKIPDEKIIAFLKKWTLKLGAVDVGFTDIKPHHIYTHIGRGDKYGDEVSLNHKYAIAFTVEMSHEALSYNPKGPVVMESAQQYLNAGQIAVQVAQLLRSLGFEARAHIDANYRLICPSVAQDAGLGVVGRMGLLMTPKLGPRVRIGVVSTDFELPLSSKPVDYSMIHFCDICMKCAENCPSQSIPVNSVKGVEKPERWTINQEKCFTYWCKVGTDCGRCVAVCPYSHPDNIIHNIIRWAIRRNPVNRKAALLLDDFFYGRRPALRNINDR